MSNDSDQPSAEANHVSPEQLAAIAALLPIANEKQRRRCLLLCLRKVRWYLAMRELDTQTLESPKTSRAELAKFARQARKLRATFEALPLAARLALGSEADRSEHLEQSFDDLLDRRQETLRQWVAEADAARAKLEKSNPGAQQNEPLYWLVGEIAEILAETRRYALCAIRKPRWSLRVRPRADRHRRSGSRSWRPRSRHARRDW